jgi:hypothetical protein
MLLDERPRGNAVAVGEDQVGAAASDDRPVESAGLAKAIVGLPDVAQGDREESGVPLNHVARLPGPTRHPR